MSFTAAVAALRAAIPTMTGFTAKLELPNAYDLEDCGQQFRTDGWGLTYGAAREERPLVTGTIGNNHTFTVVLCREVLTTRGSADALVTAVSAMKEDALTLQRSLLATSVLGQSDIDIIRYETTSQVRYGNQENNNWVTMAVSFNMTIRESLP